MWSISLLVCAAALLFIVLSVHGAYLSGIDSRYNIDQQHSKPFRSKKSPSETIHQYEVVEPAVVTSRDLSLTKGHHPKEVSIFVNSETDSYHLALKLNEMLLAPSFASGYQTNGEKVEESHDNCFYHGTVEGHDQWRAVFSTCYGLRGWFGDLNDPSNLYHIEPIEDTPSLTGPHALYMDLQHQNNKKKQRTCGTNSDHHGVDGSIPSTVQEFVDHHSIKKRQVPVAPQTRIVEWLVVNDYYQYTNFDSNISAVTHRAIELANQVDLLYDQLNISIVLVHSLTWTEGQNISFTNDSSLLLDRFREYHMMNKYLKGIVHDSAMLITGIEIKGPIVGLAFVNTMCQYNDGVGFVQDTRSSAAADGTTAAHELGHIFNMRHDDAASCMCPDSVEGCIMNEFIKDPVLFSQCSLDELAVAIGQGKDSCLGNHPTTLVGDPVCGNGIREPGEICDCGSHELCNDPCCNATSCTLSEGSQCGEGECCDNCQFKPYGTTCRESSTDCGVTEYCTGDSSECPRDVNQQDGTPCASNTSYCFDGLCPSLDSQCSLYWGTGATSSVPKCYTTQNVKGLKEGHCGVVDTSFVACSLDHVECGLLQCDGGQNTPIYSNIDSESSVQYGGGYVSYQGTFKLCKWLTTAATVDEVSPGLVLDGTRCGDSKLCISQQCVSISSLGLTPCPVGSNGEVCSGNGVCNNLDQCSCNIGYTGSDCGTNNNNTNTTEANTSTSSSSTSSSTIAMEITASIQSTTPISTKQLATPTSSEQSAIPTDMKQSATPTSSIPHRVQTSTTESNYTRGSSTTVSPHSISTTNPSVTGPPGSGNSGASAAAIGASVAAVVVVLILAILIAITAGIIILMVKCNKGGGNLMFVHYGDDTVVKDSTMNDVVMTKTVTTPPESFPSLESQGESSHGKDYEMRPHPTNNEVAPITTSEQSSLN